MVGPLRLPNVLFWLAVTAIVTVMAVAIWLGVPDPAATTPTLRGASTT